MILMTGEDKSNDSSNTRWDSQRMLPLRASTTNNDLHGSAIMPMTKTQRQDVIDQVVSKAEARAIQKASPESV